MDNKILDEIQDERVKQDKRWGREHDDKQSLSDFATILEGYSSGVRQMSDIGSLYAARLKLIQTAAVAVAAVEAIDRKQTKSEETRHERCDGCGL